MEADPLSQSRARGADAAPTSLGLSSVLSITLALLAGGVLRSWMLKKFFEVNGDAQIYGGLAKNMLLHGRYATGAANGVLHSTLIRLPGYPLYLAACFRVFGMENYFAACCVQIVVDLAACLLVADFARRMCPAAFGARGFHCTLWLAALCPFTAIYAAEPLTESLTIFTLALALWAALRFRERPKWGSALAFTFSVSYAALLRPDGALVGLALAPAVALGLMRRGDSTGEKHASGAKARGGAVRSMYGLKPVPFNRPSALAAFQASADAAGTRLRMALVCILLALAPFAAWTWRNWKVFHVIEPLAPRYATDPGEDTFPGWQRWMKTWCLDFVSTYEIYWNVPDNSLEIDKLPGRAFDSAAQYAETAKLAADYQAGGYDLTPEIDARFERLAEDRIAANPMRYYVVLPLGRMADMWLRPRVENLPIDLDWWVYKHHHVETRFSWAYAALNALYVLLAIAGLFLRPRLWPWMLLYLALRSALLCTIEAPEARYTLECFPMLFALGGIALSRALRKA